MKHISYDQVIEAVESNYTVEDLIKFGDRIRFIFDGETELTEIDVRIVKYSEHREKQGCHAFPDDETDLRFILGQQFEDCFRDGYSTIYIHKAA